MHRDCRTRKRTNRTVAVELLAILNVGVFPVLALTLFVEGPIVQEDALPPLRNIYARTVGKRVAPKLRQGEFNRSACRVFA